MSSGVALIGILDGTIIETHPGETVTCPAHEEHWHGATADQFMEHLALWEGDGIGLPETEWLEPVTDEQCNGVRSNER
jgi:quercetin dioxygenase-like cupin family protein